MKKTALAMAALLLTGYATTVAALGEYDYVDIHPAGWKSSVSVAINDAGQVAGYGLTAEGERGFLRTGGTTTVILPPGATEGRIVGMNGRGDIAGTAVVGGESRAFLYREGAYLFPVLQRGWTEASSIGEDGTLYGTGEFGVFSARDGVVEVYPYFTEIAGGNSAGRLAGRIDNTARILIPGQGYLTINPPGAQSSAATAINESGSVALTTLQPSGSKGYVYTGGYYVLMIPPGWTSSCATAVNDFGEAAGYGDSPEGRRGFLRAGSGYREIAFPGWSATEALSVNNGSQVAGSGTAPSGETHAFIASPQGAAAGSAAGAASSAGSAGGGCSMAPSSGSGKLSGPSAAASVILLFLPLLVLRSRTRRRS